MGKYTAQLRQLKYKMDRERTMSTTRTNQYSVEAINEDGITRIFRISGTRAFIENYMDELRDQGFNNVAIISEY